jgi:hypothetical protein
VKDVDDDETLPEPAMLAGTLIESFAGEEASDTLAAAAVVTWTSLQLITLPPESVFTM